MIKNIITMFIFLTIAIGGFAYVVFAGGQSVTNDTRKIEEYSETQYYEGIVKTVWSGKGDRIYELTYDGEKYIIYRAFETVAITKK